MDCLKTDNFTSFRALVDSLDPLDREEVLQMYQKAYHYLKTGDPKTPPRPPEPKSTIDATSFCSQNGSRDEGTRLGADL